jgi:uncharacterized protein with FMN-binding domain
VRRIVSVISGTIVGLVLLMLWPTSWNRPVTSDVPGTGSAGAPPSSSGTPSPAEPASPGATPTAGAPSTTQTFDGEAVGTRYGDVQVEIVVTDGKVTSADAIAYPTENGRDRQINAYALPILNDEVVAAQSAKIDMVSGASVTSRGYIQSLQDALDQAGL